MKNLFILGCFILSLGACTVPQSLNQKTYMERYKNQVNPGNILVDAGPVHSIERSPENTYIYKEYFFETGRKVVEATYVNAKLSLNHGPIYTWTDDGQLLSEGKYIRGKKEGLFVNYHPITGQLVQKGKYIDNLKEGYWEHFNDKGHKISETPFVKDKKQGWLKTYHPDGAFKDSIEYRDDICMRADTAISIEVQPAFPCNPKLVANEKCGENSLMLYLSQQIKYPGDARSIGITGRTMTTFVVDKTGEITDVYVYHGICKSIKAECERVIRNMPVWSPGSANGQPVKVRYTLPISFRLE
jgi:antitoxin component YwqK of YwqJK toxin-antitoxin module